MKIGANLGHSNNPQPIGLLPGLFSNPDSSPIQDVSKQIADVLDSPTQVQLNNSQNRLGALLVELQNEVKRISNSIGYSYESDDYDYRLAQPQYILDRTFRLLLKSNKQLNKIYKKLIQLFINNSLNTNIQNMLYKSYFENLIYEFMNPNHKHFDEYRTNLISASNINVVKDILSWIKKEGIINYSYLLQINPNEKNFKQFHKDQISLIGKSGVTYLDATDINIWTNGEDLIQFIKSIGNTGVRFINLSKNILGKIINYDPDLLSEFIKTAGESGIKSIDLSDNGFDEVYESLGSPAELVRIAGLSGIKNINLGSNFFDNITSLNKENIIEFIKTAGESGIKVIGLSDIGLNEIFANNSKLFIIFIKTAGESGIKSIDLSDNGFDDIFENFSQLVDFIEIAGKSGITSLVLKNSNIGKLLESKDFIHIPSIDFQRLLELLPTLGIKNLNLESNRIMSRVNNFTGAPSYYIEQLLKEYKNSTDFKILIN